MGATITFANKKGGSGKTTTIVNIAGMLGKLGFRVLCIDLDPQAHLSYWSGINTYSTYPSIYDVLLDEVPLNAALQKASHGLYDIIPASTHFSTEVLKAFVNRPQPEHVLAKKVLLLKRKYDFILIDTPPTMAVLTVSALVASDYVIVPVLLNFLAVEGLAQLAQHIYKLNMQMNPHLKLLCIVPNQHDVRSNHAKEIMAELVENFGNDMVAPRIRHDVRITESPGARTPVVAYAPGSKGAMDYRILTEFVLDKLGIQIKGDTGVTV